ncbi:hypothetical protein, partial [Burkholderia multivorans]
MSNVPKSPAATRAKAPSARHPDGAADARGQQGQPPRRQQDEQAGKPPRAAPPQDARAPRRER